MSAQPNASAGVAPDGQSTPDSTTLLERFSSRRSKELVVAFAGPIGCGIGAVINIARSRLKDLGYADVVHIKLSDFLEDAIKERRIHGAQLLTGHSDRFNRYRRLQEAGMELRRRTENQAILAEYAIRHIRIDRTQRTPTSAINHPDIPTVPRQVAYLIDQVKRPEEVVLLRALYRNLFHLVGVTRTYKERPALLQNDSIRVEEAPVLAEIDGNESDDFGQRLDKTLHLADYFIRNDFSSGLDTNSERIDRLFRLIHGDRSITPTSMEHGMYAAYAAGLRSACLSRQVGAAIAGADGEVLATGCNDVPRAGGGLYSATDGKNDARCVKKPEQHCWNDFHKLALRSEIGKRIDSALGEAIEGEDPIRLSSARKESLLASLYKTRLKDLIEFSRSVHAEMDAIVSLARLGGPGIKGATLYTTTFPCHSCARHIVASGIAKVYYIEPYEKSMARELHEDSIAFEFSADKQKPNLVKFEHFEGVAPRRFSQFFAGSDRKTKEGKFIPMREAPVEKSIPEYLDNYQSFEVAAVAHFQSDLEKIPPNTAV